MQIIVMVSDIYAECPIQSLNAECPIQALNFECPIQALNAECHHAECRYAECHYGEWRGAQRTAYTHPGRGESVPHSKVGSLPYPQTLN